MARPSLTGSRIRERRLVLGRKQAELARAVGVSPSYLNLIEHNRRRIGGKLVRAIAQELRVEVAQLTEGAEAALVNTLREAAADHPAGAEDLSRLEEFVGRFPGLAQLLADTRRRAMSLERTIEVLSDRMTHDPFLSASLHEILSTITAIRSTAGILVDTPEIDAEWRGRFHRNIAEESQRLAESAEGLVRYLDTADQTDTAGQTPQEEMDGWLAARGYHAAETERALPPDPADVVARADGLKSRAAQGMAAEYLRRYRKDAEHMPLARMPEALAETGLDPARLAARFGVDLPAAFRRLAAMPEEVLGGTVGLVACDGSGTLTFRKPVEGFAVPRYSAACPLWPLYQALSRPMAPVRQVIEIVGRAPQVFLTYAVCHPPQPAGFGGPQVLEALMLVVPIDLALARGPGSVPGTGPGTAPGTGPGTGLRTAPAAVTVTEAERAAAAPMGTSCRICARAECPARREPSIMAETA